MKILNCPSPTEFSTLTIPELREDPERSEAILSRMPAGRWGKPEDSEGVTVFLSSAASDYVLGSVYLVDGGWMGR